MADDMTATTPETQVAENTTTPVGQEPAEQSQDPKESEMTVEDYKDALEKVRAEAAKYRVERNELRADAQAYREMKENEKTELQKAQEALEAERARAQGFEVQLQRAKVLAQYGIAEDNADLLGDDPEKFEANAQKLAAIQKEAAQKASPPSQTPVENLTPGAGVNPPNQPDVGFPTSWPVSGPYARNK
ncbi:hypothetical protein [Corynebacterium cystitidis]|uniref:hypothetical protein n=1 Tax=Corynebacterium cystitidis TaxID=35757 RepID=UPI00211EC04D|nr:hypothetical protein [Corynebacterium cystitidis]